MIMRSSANIRMPGKSGRSIEGRAQFIQMMDDIKAEKDRVSYVLVFKLSRFGRNAADVLSSLQVMQDYGVNLICVEDGIDSSKDAGKLIISVLSAVAEIEKENIRVQDSKRRNICKKKILYIEKKVNDIDEEYVRIQLYKSLMLSVTRYCIGDWSEIKTDYSYVDKQFLNKQFTKYGKYHIKELLRTIYQMHMDELLPEILISIRNS